MAQTQTAEEGFWKYVVRNPSGCWSWTGPKYGPLKYAGFGAGGKYLLAHRVSYEIHIGPIPSGMLVCHTCDNPLCTNPAHFFLGTHRENFDDMYRKGRYRNGMTGKPGPVGNRKLTDAQIADIRTQIASGARNKDLALMFKVNPSSISRIRGGQRWV